MVVPNDAASGARSERVVPTNHGVCTEGAASDASRWSDEAEVIVVGCGSGGGVAAIEAARAGADVLVIEKMDWLGGCMRRCGGGLIGCNTLVQQKLCVEDNPDILYDYMAACCEGDYDPNLLRTFVDNCGPDLDWFISPVEEGGLGGQPLDEWEFATPDDGWTGLVSPGLNIGSPTPMYWEKFGFEGVEKRRCHWFKPNPNDVDPGDRHYATYADNDFGGGYGSKGGGGTGLWKPVEDELNRLDNVRIQRNTTICSIVMSDDDGVVGISAFKKGDDKKEFIKAKKAVVIATGSFVNDRELYRAFTGREWGRSSTTNGSPYNADQADGAGVRAILEIGGMTAFIEEGNSGGLKINAEAQVIGRNDAVIPRLFLTSRAVGGLFKDEYYPQCGAFVSSAICFGRIAGRNAAALNAWE